jgi:hypothetical protein
MLVQRLHHVKEQNSSLIGDANQAHDGNSHPVSLARSIRPWPLPRFKSSMTPHPVNSIAKGIDDLTHSG